MGRTLSLGIAGVGSHVLKNTLPALLQCPAIRVTSLWTRAPETALQVSKATEASCAASLEALCSDPRLDVIYIALPTGLHQTAAEAALAAGKHVWVEKSLCCEPLAWKDLVKTGRERGLAVFECMMFAFHPQFSKVQAILREGRIGSIERINARFGFPHRAPDDFRYSVELGGGALLDAGAYPLAAACMLSEANFARVCSHLKYSDSFEVDIAGAAQIIWENEVVSHLDWAFGCAYRNELEIWGTEAFLRTDRIFSKTPSLTTRIVIEESHQRSEIIEIPPANHFVSMFEKFASAVLDNNHAPLLDRVCRQGELLEAVLRDSGG